MYNVLKSKTFQTQSRMKLGIRALLSDVSTQKGIKRVNISNIIHGRKFIPTEAILVPHEPPPEPNVYALCIEKILDISKGNPMRQL